MIKKILLTIGLSFALVQTASALTVQTSSENNIFYRYDDSMGRDPSITASFGKYLLSDEYGIMVTVSTFGQGGGEDRGYTSDTAFFKLDNASLVREGKELYLVIGDQAHLVATKKFFIWKPVDGVKIKTSSVESGSNITVSASLEIND